MHIGLLELVIVGAAVFCGAIIQGNLGFGTTITAFAVIVLVEPELLPQSLMIASTPMIATLLVRHFRGGKIADVATVLVGRVPGIALAIYLLRTVDHTYIVMGGAFLVLAVVVSSAKGATIRRTRATLLIGGVASGLGGTALSIGGPPVALLYQREQGPALRSTMSWLAATGVPVAALGLALSGEFSATDLRTGLALVPFTMAGTIVAPKLTPWFDGRLRPIVLTVCGAGALVALLRLLVG
jgi:hypothetical protein